MKTMIEDKAIDGLADLMVLALFAALLVWAYWR